MILDMDLHRNPEEDELLIQNSTSGTTSRGSLRSGSNRSGSIFLTTIPENVPLDKWEQDSIDTCEQQFAVAWVGILRNEVLLLDIGEENVPTLVLDTSRKLLEQEPVLGWDSCCDNSTTTSTAIDCSDSSDVRGLRFHVFDDQLCDDDDENNEFTVWIFCCVYNAKYMSEVQAKYFVQKNMVSLTQTLRAADPNWLYGDCHACQNLFAPILQDRMEDLARECIPSTNSIKTRRKCLQMPDEKDVSYDLTITDSIIEENRRLVESHLSDEDEEVDEPRFRDYSSCDSPPPPLEDTEDSTNNSAYDDLTTDPKFELMLRQWHDNDKINNFFLTHELSPLGQSTFDDNEHKTDEVIPVVCMVKNQTADSPHQDLFRKSLPTLSLKDATNYGLGGKMLVARENLWRDALGNPIQPDLHEDSCINNDTFVPSFVAVDSKKLLTITNKRSDTLPHDSPTSIITAGSNFDMENNLQSVLSPCEPVQATKQKTSERYCFLCRLFPSKKSALV